MSHRLTSKPGRLLVGSLSAVALVAGLLAGPTFATASSPEGDAAKIAPEVAANLADGASASFWIRFARHADLAAAERIEDWDARGQAVYDSLRATARASQGSVKALLDERGAAYEAFFITNAIFVPSGTLALATEVASHAEVAQILPSPKYSIPEPKQWDEGTPAPDAIEWGVQNIKAPEVWSEYGDRGERIVVALIDTGVQYNHPALVNQYRGQKADGTFNHNYDWFDSSGSTSAPFDQNGHGTHVMGTMVGDDGGANQIGVAPKAKWIATNGCHTCAFEDLIESGEWLLAPTKLDGTRPKTKEAPARDQQLVGHPVQLRPVHGGRPHRLGGVRDLRDVGERQRGPELLDRQVAGQPDRRVLHRCDRHQQQHRELLVARPGPEQRDQAEHQRTGGQRPLVDSRIGLRQPVGYVDGLTPRLRRDRTVVVGGAGRQA